MPSSRASSSVLPGGFGPGLGLPGGPGGRLLAPAAPDEPVDGDPAGDVAQAGDEGDEEQEEGGDAGHVDGDQVEVGGVAPAGDVVPQLEQPQPGLAGVGAGLVHHAPGVAGQALGGGQAGVVLAVVEEQQRLGVVGAVELALGEQVGVDGAGAGQGELAGQHDRDRPVDAGRDDRQAAGELDLGQGGVVVGGPL